MSFFLQRLEKNVLEDKLNGYWDILRAIGYLRKTRLLHVCAPTEDSERPNWKGIVCSHGPVNRDQGTEWPRDWFIEDIVGENLFRCSF